MSGLLESDARLVDERAGVGDDPALAPRVLEDRVQDAERIERRLRRAARAGHVRHELLDLAAADLVEPAVAEEGGELHAHARLVRLDGRTLAAHGLQAVDEQLADLGDRHALVARGDGSDRANHLAQLGLGDRPGQPVARGGRALRADPALDLRRADPLHEPCFAVYRGVMERLNITLDDVHAEKLARLAERTHVQPGTVARSLLSSALDEVDADARNVVELLDGIAGAHDRAQLGRAQAEAGETVSLDEL